jgi:hypothetical protein
MSGTDKLPAMRVAVIGAGYARHSDPECHMLTKPKSWWINNPEDVARGIDTRAADRDRLVRSVGILHLV